MSDETTRYVVVRYPNGYGIVDKQKRNSIVFSTTTRAKAHAEARRLNAEHTATRA